ncbi:DCL family protein [Stenotrophomonas maltophilia]|uniref:DCL family protein n=1 Tax=Stenotrophomonas maltophilia TaxID=40324 RepID=UPI0009BDC481|nr:DCL family protein [Stenotrophomonas maltophilia]
MPAKPISLGHMNFAKRGDAVKYLREMLYQYSLGDRVADGDAVILMAALEHHPSASEKIGSGVSHFSVRSADFGTRCFWVNRLDGTSEKFSITGSIHGR